MAGRHQHGARQAALLTWYRRHKRDLPWRRSCDPYAILVSEVMLQQTQVDRVIPYFQRWLAAFPDVASLAQADLDMVHRLWQGLGYPSRAQRLREACRLIAVQGWPQDVAALQTLPGIGPYTAAAVACFAFKAAVPLVDTNVARVYARCDGCVGPAPVFWQHAGAYVAAEDPVAWNNALMELGATVCTARRPACERCPWAVYCVSAGDVRRVAETATPLRSASSSGPAPLRQRGGSHHLIALARDGQGDYLVGRGSLFLPHGQRSGPTAADRQSLAALLSASGGQRLLSARPFCAWYDAETDCTWHAYRCRLYADVPLAAPWRFVDVAALVKRRWPPAWTVLRQRCLSYRPHRLTQGG